jgi:hypothetical protein
MARNLEPQTLALKQQLTKGVLVTLPQPVAGGKATEIRALRFQYNPETLTRTRTGQWETKAGKNPAQDKVLTDAHRGGGLLAKSEVLTLKVVFDVSEALLGPDGAAYEATGVLPELGVLEGMALGKDTLGEEEKKGPKLISLHPTELLLVLGTRRFPVVITSMTITEQRFDAKLTPTRAEVDLRFRLLEAGENTANSKVQQAFEKLRRDRESQADQAVYTGTDEDQAITRALDPQRSAAALERALQPVPEG